MAVTTTGLVPRTHAREGGFVVFQIGMTIRRPHRVDRWLPVARAMLRMLAELDAARDAAARDEGEDPGFLGAEMLVGSRGPWVVQYWATAEQLHGYARDREAGHLPAWREFNRAARTSPGAVGIWHETLCVPDGGAETFYGQGACVGLGRVTGTRPLRRAG